MDRAIECAIAYSTVLASLTAFDRIVTGILFDIEFFGLCSSNDGSTAVAFAEQHRQLVQQSANACCGTSADLL